MTRFRMDKRLKNRILTLGVLATVAIILALLPRVAEAYQCCGCGPICGPGTGVSCHSPIIIDVDKEGFHLTSARNGVTFDISGSGNPIQIAWTDAQFHNALLALPGSDGLVHNGKQLFGNFTPQPQSAEPNGFLALAQFDKPENGGNGDGIIDARDAVFSKLRLWIDENHDGICQPKEIHTLSEFGVFSIGLKYRESPRVDRYGNQFRFRGRVNITDKEEDESQVDQIAYDVFLIAETN